MNDKQVVINVDDVGMHPAIDCAVVRLAEKKLISSASVMSLTSPDAVAIAELARLHVDLGLHVDLTSSVANQRYQASRSVRSLILDSWHGRLDAVHMRSILHDQLDRFEHIADPPPCFIDGHEHVHQFPTIREALFAVLRDRYPGQRLFVRNTVPLVWRGSKAATIAMLGGRRMRKLAETDGHLCNTDFAGVYDFDPRSALSSLWRRWLQSLPSHGGLVMSHPAVPPAMRSDNIGVARVAEFQFLDGGEFAELLNKYGVRAARWTETNIREREK